MLSILIATPAFGLEANEILIIANSNCADSMALANYYCQKRHVPKGNIFALPLTWPAGDTVGRSDYVQQIAEPIRKKLNTSPFKGTIKCLLTTYGVPIKVAAKPAEPNKLQEIAQLELLIKERADRLAGIIAQLQLLGVENPPAAAPTPNPSTKTMLGEVDAYSEAAIKRIKTLKESARRTDVYMRWLGYYDLLYGKPNALKMAIEHQKIAVPPSPKEQARQTQITQAHIFFINKAGQERWPLEQRIKKGYYASLEHVAGIKGTLLHLQMEIDSHNGKETNAAVDSELSMVLFGDHNLYRWQPNELKDRAFWLDARTMMVSRLDGPGPAIAKGLIDKAMAAEANGVTGKAYFDLRCSGDNSGLYSPGYYDNSLLEAAETVRQETKWPVIVEQTPKLFEPGQCPQTALYCGWYSLQKYIPSFTFVTGAVGYHIASFEAIHLRDAASPEWCPSMLKDGITATLGAVAEPYLQAFPEPKPFFEELLSGECLVEVYYKTLPYNSWQIILIGDPLYRFKIKK
ncbi:MAG: TIGR03790 family protein [Sedimentisphaerales bacterium]|nr:TIGR03790 family protein [Sedimentisphaerales bacterium]